MDHGVLYSLRLALAKFKAFTLPTSHPASLILRHFQILVKNLVEYHLFKLSNDDFKLTRTYFCKYELFLFSNKWVILVHCLGHQTKCFK